MSGRLERSISPEDLQADVHAAMEARERRGREEQERAAKQLADILSAPQSASSRRYTFNVFGDDAADQEGEQEDTAE